MPAPLVDLPALRAYLLVHAVEGVDEIEVRPDGSSCHRRLVPTPVGAMLLEVFLPAGAVGEPVIEAVPGGTTDATASPEGVAAVVAAGHRWLGLDADPAPGVAALTDDPVLGPLVLARPHVRVPGATDPFEAAVNVVFGQHVSLAAGRVFAGRLAAAYGVGHPVRMGHGVDQGPRMGHGVDQGPRMGHGVDHPVRMGHGVGHRPTVSGLRAYPAPAVLAAADADELRATVGITGARARTVVALARAVADGVLDLSPTDDRDVRRTMRAVLLALPGVGPWTADLVALRCLRDPDLFLPGDLVLRKAMGGVTAREADRQARAWAPHRSLAVLHLWTHHAIDPR